MKKLFFIFYITLIIIGCKDNEAFIDKTTIKQLSKGNFQIPSQYGFLLLFIKLDDCIGYTNVNVLRSIYSQIYQNSYDKFEIFLEDALNQKIIFRHADLNTFNVSAFALNDTIKMKYELRNINEFSKSYCVSKNKNTLVVKKQYQTGNQLPTILYYFFLNNYKITEDDYIGEFLIKNLLLNNF